MSVSIAEARRIPMEDLRAWVRVFPKQRRRDTTFSAERMVEHWRVHRLTIDPHYDCEHERGICIATWGRG